MRHSRGVFLLLFFFIQAAGADTLKKGDFIPDLTLPSFKGEKVRLRAFAKNQKKRNLLLVFFRTGSCPVCVSQLKEVASHSKQLATDNVAILAISLDDAIIHARTSEKLENAFPLLLDPDAKAIKAFGVLNLEDKLSKPSLFLVAKDGKILYDYVGSSISDRPPFSEILEAAHHYSGGLPKRKGA